MRDHEFPMLRDTTYLDHGGTTLASKSLLQSFCREMQSNLLANPHSDAANPSVSAVIVEKTRLKVLKLFNADPDHFDVVFTANATGAIKLVMEGFSGNDSGFDYYYHRNCHTSLVGVREVASRSHCLTSDEETRRWLDEGPEVTEGDASARPVLFAYPAQSNMNGQRLPLYWPTQIRSSTRHPATYTLLDVAALVSTSPLNLSNHLSAPDFVALSFYKIFGFPDLGALIVRKASAHALDHRKYFGGGTTEMITCIDGQWVARKQSSIHARWEDGTIAIRSILALSCAIDTHQELFGGLRSVSDHTGWLAKLLYERMTQLKHANGSSVCHMYKAPESSYDDATTQGATVAFNIRKSDGSWMSGWQVGAMLRAKNIHVRTGGLCNPAGMACALEISTTEIQRAFNAGFRCNQQQDVRGGVLFGMIRVTLGAMSTRQDVELLARFIEDHLIDRHCRWASKPLSADLPSSTSKEEKHQGLGCESETKKRGVVGIIRAHTTRTYQEKDNSSSCVTLQKASSRKKLFVWKTRFESLV
ncbi:molybdenum cofactor sulfurase [Dothidotthia symphoricarpi CBS 119687]|uniref:Molybdenum cofactor sulfurase n=1 Tax=Dothidotthia symphoricarpi CBS 119687 TaxID=1392245 RepID=A0A6A6ADR7_9PLEO|nr:molybdenum cofactor sulfurase [Dothidotthia symphoricarpi CBS 119687]KAF2129235.1 molybdenum cofactor sulfurase [Dothidotthia symphoricarpi CBS 119687]